MKLCAPYKVVILCSIFDFLFMIFLLPRFVSYGQKLYNYECKYQMNNYECILCIIMSASIK